MTHNIALWLPACRADWSVVDAPYTEPGSNEIVVRVRAVAVNPIDRLMRTVGDLVAPTMRYPMIPGSDVAGEVVSIGLAVTRFKPGDRVLGFAAGADKARNRAAEGAFQLFAVLLEHMAAPLPDDMAFEHGAVLPLGLSTAASGLFQRDFLALDTPCATPSRKDEVVLVWGGSTSVGSNAIQLARAAGYEVVTTASPHNFDYVRQLGASRVFNYRAPTVLHDLIDALQGRKVVGALAIGRGSSRACVEVIGACGGRRFVALATPAASFDAVPAGPARWRKLAPAIVGMAVGNASLALRARLLKVTTKFIWGSAPVGNEIGPLIFSQFLPGALREGRYVAAPPPMIVGHGLDRIPEALERQREGVSAAKLVVTL